MMRTIAILGGSGFVGRACLTEAKAQGLDVEILSAPRLSLAGETSLSSVIIQSGSSVLAKTVDGLAAKLKGFDVVINAAGVADPRAEGTRELFGANALMPLVIDRARKAAGVARLVHLSSAAVQGRRAKLDESSERAPFSPYSSSKALGEEALLATSDGSISCYRATSVHGMARPLTAALSRFARSPLSSVAGTGSGPTPQALVENVAAGVLHVAQSGTPPPEIVLHPWEGLSCADALRLLGQKDPIRVPTRLARSIVGLAARVRPQSALNRRLEMLWFGQDQAPGWFAAEMWEAPAGRDSWRCLGVKMRGDGP